MSTSTAHCDQYGRAEQHETNDQKSKSNMMDSKSAHKIPPVRKNEYTLPLVLVTSLFFLWGFSNNLTGILIPHLRKALQLTNLQSTFVDTAVYTAYFLSAIPAGMILRSKGYKNGIILGLLLFSLGAFLFIPAANSRAYLLFLAGLFIIGCGLTILETAANPYATKLGDPQTATTRLNLAQSFNGLAAFLAPVIGTRFILSGREYTEQELSAMTDADRLSYLASEAASVKMPYMLLGAFLILIAVIFYINRLPEFREEEDASDGSIRGALAHGHLRWAVIAQFFYVGAQVCVTSFFVRMAIKGGGVDEKTAGDYLGIYGLLFMSGRFAGTAIMRYVTPTRLLAVYSGICILLSLVAIYADGRNVVLALGGLGFFMSIMFPTIFSLGIRDLKEHTKQGSSLIVMSIIGGAIFPVLMGAIIDSMNDDIQIGYTVPLACYFVVLYFALKGHQTRQAA
jgi:FHS family L-fucose permease-like MFS transporter